MVFFALVLVPASVCTVLLGSGLVKLAEMASLGESTRLEAGTPFTGASAACLKATEQKYQYWLFL